MERELQKKRVAIYVRVSTAGQYEEGYSIEEQIDALKKYCEARNWGIYKVYQDADSGAKLKRPGLETLIRDIANFNTVLVYKLDRLSRSLRNTLYLIEDIFEPNNIDFMSYCENFDTSTSFGRFTISVLSTFAQLEREQINDRMMMGKLGRAKDGKPSTWAKDTFGYNYIRGNGKQKGYFKTNPLQASIVKQIFNDYLAGTSLSVLFQKLNSEGHLGKTKKWTMSTVRKVLRNITYTGRIKFRGEIYKGEHEAIISDDIYEKVQLELKRRQKAAYERSNISRPFQAKYFLSGFLRCGLCGATLVLIQGRVRKDGTRFKRYQCASQMSEKHSPSISRPSEPCNLPVWEKDKLDAFVLAKLDALIKDPSIINIRAKESSSNIENEVINKRLEGIDKELERLTELYVRGRLPMKKLDEMQEELEREQEGLRARITTTQDPNVMNPKEALKLIEDMPNNIYELSEARQKVILGTFVNYIEIYKNIKKTNIHWRF